MGPNRGGGRHARKAAGRGAGGSNAKRGAGGAAGSSSQAATSDRQPAAAPAAAGSQRAGRGAAAAAQTVQLSSENRQLMEGLLEQLAPATAALSLSGTASGARLPDVERKVLAELLKKGFVAEDAAAALRATAAVAAVEGDYQQPFNEQKRRAARRALDHLVLALPDHQLPAGLQPAQPRPRPRAGSSAPPADLPAAQPAAPALPRRVNSPGVAAPPESNGAVHASRSAVDLAAAASASELDALVAAGFSRAQASQALASQRGALAALEHLCASVRPDRLAARQAAAADLPGGDGGDAQLAEQLAEVREEELLALAAILGPAAAQGCGPGSLRLRLAAPAEGLPGPGELAVAFDPGGLYPYHPPAQLVYSNPELAFPALAAVAAALARQAALLAAGGQPMLHDLLLWLRHQAAAVVAQSGSQLRARGGAGQAASSAADGTQEPPQPASQAGGPLAEEDAEEARQRDRVDLLRRLLASEQGSQGGQPEGPPGSAAARQAGAQLPSRAPSAAGEQDDADQPDAAASAGPRRGAARAAREAARREQQAALQRGLEALRVGQVEAGQGEEEEQEDPATRQAAQEADAAAAQQAAQQAAAEREAAAEAAHAADLAAHGATRSRMLAQQLRQWQASTDPAIVAMRAQRERLPSWGLQQQLVAAISSSRVVVVSGQTGCGKTTQVPQFVLDDLIQRGQGGAANIICTQPRRISATAVAARVAAERGEALGQTVGYQIRAEAVRSARTRLLFCTTGVLLRRLAGDRGLTGVSHVLVDEVHERSLDSDFLLILLRDLLPRRPGLRLVLMSATVNEAAFAAYFGGCPTLHIPGFTHPVREHFLEDVLALTRYRPGPACDALRPPAGSGNGRSGAAAAALQAELRAADALAGQGYAREVVAAVKALDPDKINYELLVAVLEWVVQQGQPGAVLVFLSGLMEISKLHEACRASPSIFAATDKGKYLIGLHSTLSSADQQTIFQHPPEGVRKIVLSTNVAETSITIDDVVWVLDTGKVKENRYSPEAHMVQLVEGWVARASAQQRRGRAGRTQPGHCLRFFTRHTHEAVMAAYQVPEMLRVPLEGLALQVKLLGWAAPVDQFLAQALEPPSKAAVAAALASLTRIGALAAGGALTPLGHHLARLPVDVRVGKMLVYAAILGCLAPALTIAAALASRSPFTSPLEAREAADAARRAFAGRQASDHLAVLAAYDAWRAARQQGRAAERAFCRDNFLSARALEGMADLRRQLRGALADAGFLSAGRTRSHGQARRRRGGRDAQPGSMQGGSGPGAEEADADAADGPTTDPADAHAGNLQLVVAVLCAGLYPNIVRVDQPAAPAGKGRRAGPPRGAGPKLVAWMQGDKQQEQIVSIHPCSVNFEAAGLPTGWLVYHELVQTSAVYLRDCTCVTPYALLLFGGVIEVQHSSMSVTLDKWVRLHCSPKVAVLFKQLRAQLDRLLQEKIEQPGADIWGHGASVVTAIIQLISTESEHKK